jgi:hypothetical protein
VLAEQLIESLRRQRVIVPAMTMIDRLCAEALGLKDGWMTKESLPVNEHGSRQKADFAGVA